MAFFVKVVDMPVELSIVIPAYNEEKRLPPTLKRLFPYLKENYRGIYEVIISDDGSEDRTAEVVEDLMKIHPELRLSRFPHRGYGGVVRQGMLAAEGEYILAMDADGSTNEEAITRFLNFMRVHPEIGMVVGSRTIDGAQIVTAQPLLRVFLGNVFLFVAWLLFGWPMQDRINGFKMFRRECARDTFPHQIEDGVIGAAEIVYICDRRGWKYELLPIFWTDFRGSKIRPFRESCRSLAGMLKILWRNRKGAYVETTAERRI